MNKSYGFEFIVNFSMQTFQIKPPLSFEALMEISQERFDITKISGFYIDDEEITITNDADYLKLLEWAEKSKLKEIELILENKEIKKKRIQSLRKISKTLKPIDTEDINEIQENDDKINGIFYYKKIIYFKNS